MGRVIISNYFSDLNQLFLFSFIVKSQENGFFSVRVKPVE